MQPKSIFKLFLKYFFRGLLYAAPVTITIYIIVELFKFFDGMPRSSSLFHEDEDDSEGDESSLSDDENDEEQK